MNPDNSAQADSAENKTPTANRPNGRRRLLGAAAAIAASAGLGVAWWRERTPTLSQTASQDAANGASDPALLAFWQAGFDTPTGGRLSTSAFRGRPLLVNFWATWCPPCVEELPLIEAFYRQNSPKSWQVIGIAADRATAVNQFLVKLPLSFPVAIAGLDGVALSRSLGNVAGGLPYTVVIGGDGRVIQRKMGQIQTEDLSRWASMG